ncbi:MAG: hypothetical protein KTR21_04875 [Rhodobacteraceae bacterium]|nr:hypothetical protein [Paracoccaceae bacterium]
MAATCKTLLLKAVAAHTALFLAAWVALWGAPGAAQTANSDHAVKTAPKPAARQVASPPSVKQPAAKPKAPEASAAWRNERFETYGDWLLSCEVAVAEQPSATPPPRRCYLQNAQTYQPPPNFRSATLFLLSTPDGYSVQLGLEPGASVANTNLAILRRPLSQVAVEVLEGAAHSSGGASAPAPEAASQETEQLFTLSECDGHLCDLGRIKSTFLLTRMYAEPTGALIWRMRPLNGARPEIRFDLTDFAAAAKAFAAADPDAARAYEEFIK